MTSSTDIVPYFGRCKIVIGGGIECKRALSEVTKVVGDISGLGGKDELWKGVKDELCTIAHHLMDESYKIDTYKLNILLTAVIPYIRVMKNRTTLSKSRFDQTMHLLRILSENDSKCGTNHPAQTLLAVEGVVSAIDREGNFWKSEFATSLSRAVNAEWQPILGDNRRAIQNICLKLGILGLIEFIRPVLLIWPLWLLVMDVLSMVKSLNDKKGLTPQAILQLLKTILLTAVLYMLVYILSLMPGMGFSCLFVAAAGCVLSCEDSILKSLCPVIAPNMAQIQQVMDSLSIGASSGGLASVADLLSSVAAKVEGGTGSPSAPVQTVGAGWDGGPRVEECNSADEDEGDDYQIVSNSTEETSLENIPVTVGLRKRK